MAFQLVVPRHRWSRTSLIFDRWLLDDGDWIKQGNAVCSLDINGVSLPVAAEHDGFLTIIAKTLKRGEELQPGRVLGYVTRPSESIPSSTRPAIAIAVPGRTPVVPAAIRRRIEWEPPCKNRAASPRAPGSCR